MATGQKNLSDYDKTSLPDGTGYRVGIVVSDWNSEITYGMLDGALAVFKDAGIPDSQIDVIHTPGSFELPLGAQMLLDSKQLDGVICIGCVIKGETAHFDYVCSACSDGIMQVSLKYGLPVAFGVLTDNNIEQSRARSGGALGNKGIECAVSLLRMIAISKSLNTQ